MHKKWTNTHRFLSQPITKSKKMLPQKQTETKQNNLIELKQEYYNEIMKVTGWQQQEKKWNTTRQSKQNSSGRLSCFPISMYCEQPGHRREGESSMEWDLKKKHDSTEGKDQQQTFT